MKISGLIAQLQELQKLRPSDAKINKAYDDGVVETLFNDATVVEEKHPGGTATVAIVQP